MATILSKTERYNEGLRNADLPRFPAPPGASEAPVWTGNGFRLGDRIERVLAYEVGPSGWTSDLTTFHEQTAAAGRHPIDTASRHCAVSSLEQGLRGIDSPAILDVGCSSGYLLRDLRSRLPNATLLGADFVLGPLERLAAILPDIPLLQFDVVRCPLPDACLDAVVLLNVLEHIEDDHAAARQAWRILKPRGLAVIELPAGPHLYDVYDQHLMHFRRYTLPQARLLMERAGFHVERASHLGFLLYPAFRWVKLRHRRYLDAAAEDQRRVVAESIRQSGANPLTAIALSMETALHRWVSFPVGIRCLLTCRKA